MTKRLTAKEINKKYKDKYVEIYQTYNYDTKQTEYEVRRVYDTIHENATLVQDVGTDMEYWR